MSRWYLHAISSVAELCFQPRDALAPEDNGAFMHFCPGGIYKPLSQFWTAISHCATWHLLSLRVGDNLTAGN